MRIHRTQRARSSQMVLGLLVIGMGVLFLLDNLEIINFRHTLPFWPLALVVVGVVKMFDSQRRNGYLVGAAMVGVGVLMLLSRLGVLYISWRSLWPLGLIAIGAGVLVRSLARPRSDEPDLKPGGGSDDVLDITAILGGVKRRVTASPLRGGEITAVMGGCELDMRSATIDGSAVLTVFALWGGISIKCPPDWTIVLEGTPIMGGFEEKTIIPPDTSKRLIVRGYAIMGGVEVRN